MRKIHKNREKNSKKVMSFEALKKMWNHRNLNEQLKSKKERVEKLK